MTANSHPGDPPDTRQAQTSPASSASSGTGQAGASPSPTHPPHPGQTQTPPVSPYPPPPYQAPSYPPPYGVPVSVTPVTWVPYPRRESFTTRAVIAAVLYWFFWLPGFIANLVWYFEARGIERDTGQAPSGKGCLLAMLFLFCLLPLGSALVWLLLLILRIWFMSQT